MMNGEQHENEPSKKRRRRRKKDEPLEMSSKRPVQPPLWSSGKSRRAREQVDPRFMDTAGEYNEHVFRSAYKFIEDLRVEELDSLKSELKKAKNDRERLRLQRKHDRLRQSLKTQEAKDKKQALKRAVRKREAEMVSQGKKPFYLKKNDQKTLEMVDKFVSLKKSGHVDQFIAKRRKKNATKDRRYIPRAATE